MLPSIAKLASQHDLKPLKKFGQNFIYDETLCDKIVRCAQINHSSNILEIGPGPAGLTRSILKANPNSLTVIEMDQRFLPLLQEVQKYHNQLSIKIGDALKTNLSQLNHQKLDIISNLPYNVGCKLLVKWLGEIASVNSMTVMLQKEVVERIIAKPSNKNYGRLSVICQILCDVEKCFEVSPKVFYPPPKVDSAIVRLVPKQHQPEAKIIQVMEDITLQAFNQRRKTLRSSLKKIPNLQVILDKLAISNNIRAENLSPQEYYQIAEQIVNNI